jgi:hypothetical protein
MDADRSGSLSALMDGEEHELVVGNHFTAPANRVVSGWDEVEEDVELDPFESPELAPILVATGETPVKLPFADLSQGYACLVMRLRNYASIMEMETRHYERNQYVPRVPPMFTFQRKNDEEVT